MDISSLLNQSPTSPLSSPPTKSSIQDRDEAIKPQNSSLPPFQVVSPALPEAQSKTKSKFKSKPECKPKAKSKSKPKPKPTPSKQPPKKTKAKSSSPPGPQPRPWITDDKIVLLNIVSSRGASIKNFEGAIEGRSGLACYIRWK
jgi:hypothetical protein